MFHDSRGSSLGQPQVAAQSSSGQAGDALSPAPRPAHGRGVPLAGWGPPAPPEPGQHRVFSLSPWARRGRHGRGGSGGSLAGRLFLRFWRRMCARRALPHFSPPPVSFRVKKGELTLLCAADLSMVTTGFQKPEQRFGSMENNNFSKFPPDAVPGMPIAALGHVPACIQLPRPWLFSRVSPPAKPNGLGHAPSQPRWHL